MRRLVPQQLQESISFFSLPFVLPVALMNSFARHVWSPMASDSEKALSYSPPLTPEESDALHANQKIVARALARFSELHLHNEPHTPAELKVIKTPLGLEPR